jgi:hypothetical protein
MRALVRQWVAIVSWWRAGMRERSRLQRAALRDRFAHEEAFLTRHGVLLFLSAAAYQMTVRLIIAGIAIAAGVAAFIGGWLDPALRAALVVLGVAIVFHVALDYSWWRLAGAPENAVGTAAVAAGAPVPAEEPSPAELHTGQGFREAAGLYISTPAVVLGLITVFGQDKLTQAVKVGSLSLAGALLLALVLYGWVVQPLPDNDRQLVMLGHVYNVLLWLLAFGVLTIALSIAHR